MSSADVGGTSVGGDGVLGEGQEARVYAGAAGEPVSEPGTAGGSVTLREPIGTERHLERQPNLPPPPAATSASPLSVWT